MRTCMVFLLLLLLIVAVHYSEQFFSNASHVSDCKWRHNISEGFLTNDRFESLENCLYYYLVDRERQVTREGRKLYLEPPIANDEVLTLTLDHLTIRHVELSWTDPRLEWDEKEWKMEEFTLHDNHHIWTPTITDESYSGSHCHMAQDCWTTIHEVDIFSVGKVSAIFSFRYPSFCVIDYYRYPEEENDCCLFFSAGEYEQMVKFEVKTESKTAVDQTVTIQTATDGTLVSQNEHSAWIIEQRTVDVVKIGGIRAQLLRICVHAEKRMGTLKMALRLPVIIATMLMLVSPLFGDLRTQVFVKLVTLLLQTLCFLFLCSIAPENGFAGTKPKIYTFFETVFVLTLLSVVLTMVAMALSRVRRTVPPSHNVFLTAKMINRFVCCIEPEPGTSYQRHVDETAQTNFESPQPDYTIEWRHIYIAANNLFSGVSLTVFVFVAAFDIL